MLSVAVSWDLYLQTKSALVLGNVGFVQVAPFLIFALLAGNLADRHDRRKIMLVTQVLMLAASLLLVTLPPSVQLIYSCLFLTALARAFQWPARSAMLPHTVEAEGLQNAITWASSAQEIASVTGPALAGILVAAAGSRTVYLVQFGCAAGALGSFFLLRYRGTPERPLSVSRQSMAEGLRFVWTDKLILSAMSLDLLAVLFGGATALLPIYAVDILHAGARGLGWLRAAPSAGAVTMALLQTHLPQARKAGRVLLASVAAFGVATVIFGLSHSLWLSFAMLALTGAFDNVSVVLRQSLVQTETPDRLRGRVLAVNSIFISSSNQLGAVESGWTAAWFGAVPSVVGGGIATVLVVAGFTVWATALRAWRR